jgi:hypothetical protein
MMIMRLMRIILLLFTASLLVFSLSACSGSSGPANAVKAYYKALVAKDSSQLANASCAAWEADGRTELESFGAVQVTMSDLSCQENGKDGDFTLVSCSGKISANYNGEVLEINLADHIYKTIQEGGDWRMCGYK